MFTGIVEELGSIISIDGPRVRVGASKVLGGVALGDSTAVNGVCLTVVGWGDDWFEADISGETFTRTTLGDLNAGDPVNLERPVRLQDRLGGHLVQGHVDGVGTVVSPVPDLRISVPTAMTRYIVEKGSITVDGISLTVVDALDDGFTCAIIPHTSEVTTLGVRGAGDSVNLEVDMMAKYAEKLLAGHMPAAD